MIADFPEVKKLMRRVMNETLRQNVHSNAPIASMAQRKVLHEGNKMGVLHENGQLTVNELKRVESRMSISDEEMLTMKPEDLLAKISTMGEDMAGQIERGMIQTIEESIKESGNTITGNPELGPDSILSALEMMYINFENDDRSKPIMPTIFAGSEAVKALLESETKLTPEKRALNNQRHETIMDKKYAEHMLDLESRKLID